MSGTCETVRVVAPVTAENPLGYVVINKCDLTEAHEIFGAPKPAADATDADEAKKQPKPARA